MQNQDVTSALVTPTVVVVTVATVRTGETARLRATAGQRESTGSGEPAGQSTGESTRNGTTEWRRGRLGTDSPPRPRGRRSGRGSTRTSGGVDGEVRGTLRRSVEAAALRAGAQLSNTGICQDRRVDATGVDDGDARFTLWPAGQDRGVGSGQFTGRGEGVGDTGAAESRVAG